MESNGRLNQIIKILLFLFLITAALYFAQDLFIPITIACLLSLLLLPIQEKLERKTGKVVSIVLCLLIIITFISSVTLLFASQVISFSDQFSELKNKATERFHDALHLIESKTSISTSNQKKWLSEMSGGKIHPGKWIQSVFMAGSSLLLTFGLIIVYIFCFLYYKEKFNSFFMSFAKEENKQRMAEALVKIKHLVSHYFIGMVIVMVILGTMHSIGLLLLGIPNAIFLGYLASMFIIVPVVGTMIGSSIPFTIALLTKDSAWYAIGVAGVFSFNIFMESQVLTPNIVGSHIKINPMAIIIAIVIGGSIWGIAGMVLFIPIVGMVKIVSQNVENLAPLDILLSDDKKEGPSFWEGLKNKFKSTK